MTPMCDVDIMTVWPWRACSGMYTITLFSRSQKERSVYYMCKTLLRLPRHPSPATTPTWIPASTTPWSHRIPFKIRNFFIKCTLISYQAFMKCSPTPHLAKTVSLHKGCMHTLTVDVHIWMSINLTEHSWSKDLRK